MQLSTKGRYATRIMVNLASQTHGKPVQKQDIAHDEGISKDYVAQLLLKLKTAGLIQSHRGVMGGFTLACDPAKVTVADILEAVEGPLCLVPCLRRVCRRQTACVTQRVWKRANAALQSVFAGTTLADMVKQAADLQGATFEI